MLQNANSIIQQIIAPATMVPACGLLILSSTVRMNTALGRVRAFHTERLDVWKSSTDRNRARVTTRSGSSASRGSRSRRTVSCAAAVSCSSRCSRSSSPWGATS